MGRKRGATVTGIGEQPQVHSNAAALADGRLCAPSASRNVGPITEALAPFVPARGRALEIASGTGQHAVAFARAFPNVTWQPTDIAPERLASIDAWRTAEGVENLRPARRLDAATADWDMGRFDLVTISNLFHLIPRPDAENVLQGAARALVPGGALFIYGPFREAGGFRSQGDAAFHARITAADPEAGYKSVEWMGAGAAAAGLKAAARLEMPANNLALVWRAPA